MALFEEYLAEDRISDALLVGRNLVNRDPKDKEIFCKYIDLLLSLAEKLPALDERRQFANQANATLTFFEENVDINDEIVALINHYHTRIKELNNLIEREITESNRARYDKAKDDNNDILKKLYKEKGKLEKATEQEALDKVLSSLGELDARLNHDILTDEQRAHYEQLNREYTALISRKMAEIERLNNIAYNKKALDAFEKAFRSFKSDEGKYKNQTQLFNLVSTTLFAYEAGKLFNETLIYYNHVYSYIFSKLDDDGKLAITRYSIECERKMR